VVVCVMAAACVAQAEAVKPARVRIVDFGHDFLRDGDGRPLYQFHVHRWGLVKNEATGLYNVGKRVELDLTVDVDGDGKTDDDVVAYHEFSLTRPFSPDAPWYDSLAGTPRWYGGAALYQANRRETGFSEDGVNHEHDGPMYLPRDNWALFHETYEFDAPYKAAAVWIWKKQDFMNGGADYRVSFDDKSESALYLQRYFMGVEGVRFVIQDGDQFYVSEAIFRGAGQKRGSGNGKQHVLCPSATKWAKYYPKAPHDIWFDAKQAQFDQRDFQDVRAVGFYVFKDRLISSYFGYKWYAFEVDAVVHRPARPSETLEMSKTPQGFYITTGPVPYLIWKNVFRLARSNTFVRDPRGFIFDRDGDMGGMDSDDAAHSPQEPVTDITLPDAAAWCNALSQQEGKTPCYYEDAEFKTVFRYVKQSPVCGPQRELPKLHVKWDADGYRLPVASEHVVKGTGLWIVRREAGLPAPQGDLTPQFTVAPKQAPSPTITRPVLEMVKVPGKSVEFAKFETTYAKWKLVRDWALTRGYQFDSDGDMGSMDYWGMNNGWGAARSHSPDEPVTDITYYDVAVWCNALSEIEGRTPAYYSDEACTKVYKEPFIYRPLMNLLFETDRDQRAGLLPKGRMEAVGKLYVKADADGYRLPRADEFTEALGGKAEPKVVLERGWMFDNSGGTTHPVGQKKPNTLGLYDLEGNVSELCMGDSPRWDIVSAVGVMPRCGGSFIDLAIGLSSTQPAPRTPAGWGYPDVGFRVVRQLGDKPEARPWLDRLASLLPTVLAAEQPAAGKLSVEPAKFDPLKGKAHRGSLLREGVFDARGVPMAKGAKWKFPTGAPIQSSPVCVDGVVYFGSNDGNIYAVTADTGKELWKVKTEGKVTGSAAVTGGVVYIASEDGNLYALDAKTGQQRWKSKYGKNGKSAGSPAVAYGVVFIGAGARSGTEYVSMSTEPVVGFDAQTGAKVWQSSSTGPQGFAAICVDGETLYAGLNGSDYMAADLASGKSKWTYSAGHQDRQFQSLCRVGDVVYIPGSMAGSVNAVNAATGKRLWRSYTYPDQVEIMVEGQPGYEIFADLAVAHGLVYAGCNDGKLHAFAADDGKPSWQFDVGAPVFSSPSVAGDLVYFGSHNGNLYALYARTGALRWKLPLGGRIRSAPWPGDGVIYVGCDDGNLYALE
jgi:outer membrane protein assembly factor BamB/formylglycine-generating enzyme required for sulfatase activity